MIDRQQNLLNHHVALQAEMKAIQDMVTDSENLPYKTLCELQEKYVKLNNTIFWIDSMANALFPPKILTPQNNNHLKTIN